METLRDLSQVEALRKELEGDFIFADMIGRSETMKNLFRLLPTIADSESTVLIEGESGRKIINIKPEFEDLKKISEKSGLALKNVIFHANFKIEEILKNKKK